MSWQAGESIDQTTILSTAGRAPKDSASVSSVKPTTLTIVPAAVLAASARLGVEAPLPQAPTGQKPILNLAS